MKKKVAIIDLFPANILIGESIGLGSISSILKKNSYDTLLVAFNEDRIEFQKIYEHNPDIVCLPVYYENVSIVNSMCQQIKKVFPSAIFITGGYMATYNTNELLNAIPYLDFAVRGEGEVTIVQLLNAIYSNQGCKDVLGISYREDGVIIHNAERALVENLDILPFPDRSVIRQHNIPFVQIEGARGCPCCCSFCSVHCFWTNSHIEELGEWRPRNTQNIVDEMEHLLMNFGINRFRFLDCSIENPDKNMNRMYELADAIISKNMNITYFINLRANAHEILTDNLLNRMIESGLSSVFIGIESFDEDDLKIFQKDSTVDDNRTMLTKLRNYPLYVNIGFINFHPYSTIQSLRNNVAMLHEFSLESKLLFFSKLMVFKGTPIYAKLLKDGLMVSDYLNPTNYKFKNLKVELIDKFITKSMKEDPMIKKIEVYSRSHPNLLYHLKHYYNHPEDAKIREFIYAYEIELNEMLANINDSFTRIFIGLLDIADRSWSESEAVDLLSKDLGDDYLQKTVKSLEKTILKLKKNFIKFKYDCSIFDTMYYNT